LPKRHPIPSTPWKGRERFLRWVPLFLGEHKNLLLFLIRAKNWGRQGVTPLERNDLDAIFDLPNEACSGIDA
jgi:hypothetical protein